MTREAVAEILLQMLYPLALGVGGYLLDMLRKTRINAVVLQAAANGAGAAYATLAANKMGVSEDALRVAAQVGAKYVEARVPDAVKSAKLNHGDVVEIVFAQLGKLLPADPTVSLDPKP